VDLQRLVSTTARFVVLAAAGGVSCCLFTIGGVVLTLAKRAGSGGIDLRPLQFNILLSWAHLTPAAIRLRGIAAIVLGLLVIAIGAGLAFAPELSGLIFLGAAVVWIGLIGTFAWEYFTRDAARRGRLD
jgi:hypothetical protein